MKRLVLGLALVALGAIPLWRAHRAARLRAEIIALEKEREELEARIDQRMAADPRLRRMPQTPVRVAIPASLVRVFLERLASSVVDQLRLELTDVRVRRRGEIRKLVSLGRYDLDLTIHRLEGRLRAGRPRLRLGGNEVQLSVPVTIESGEGRGTLLFRWDGSNVSGALCGDLRVRQPVSGVVRRESYVLRGGFALSASERQIVAKPRVPPTRLRVHVEPSAASWRAVAAILDQKKGACGVALDAVDVMGSLRGLLRKGIEVRLPTEKVPTITVPVRLEPTVVVGGRPLTLTIRLGRLTVTPRDLWLGAVVAVGPAEPRAGASAEGAAGGLAISARTTPVGP